MIDKMTDLEKNKILNKYINPIFSDNRNWREDIPEYDKYFDSVEQELKGLPKENGVVVDSEIVIETGCAVCGDNNHKQVLCKYGFLYVECNSCGHIYVFNRLRDEKILADYSGGNDLEKITHKIEKTDKLQEYTNNLYNKYLSLFSDLGIRKGRLLDVGCGAGNFVDYCVKNTTYDVYANEINEDMHEGLGQIVGNNLIAGPIEDQEFQNKQFDIITLWGVLEHLINPMAVLAQVKNIIKESGYIMALIPNINSRAYKLLGAKTPTLNPKVHIQMFTEDSFKLMCDKAGLKIVELFGELPVIDLMYDFCRYDDQLISEIMGNNESYYHAYLIAK